MPTPIPIIRLELEHMKHTLSIALSNYTAELDASLKAAVEAYCTPENLNRVIRQRTDQVLTQVIQEEVKHWFIYGEGRKAIKEAVENRLKMNETYTPLDRAEQPGVAS